MSRSCHWLTGNDFVFIFDYIEKKVLKMSTKKKSNQSSPLRSQPDYSEQAMQKRLDELEKNLKEEFKKKKNEQR